MIKEHTKEEKAVYFKGLREQWNAAKVHALNGRKAEIEAIIMNHGMKISNTGFLFVKLQMEAQGLDGLPYLDTKTFKGWKENGFRVMKGQKSTLSGITWIGIYKEDDEIKSSYAIPKEYHLFHKSQVEAV